MLKLFIHPWLTLALAFIFFLSFRVMANPPADFLDNPSSLLSALSQRKILENYDENQLLQVVDQYNRRQNTVFKVNPDNPSNLTKGYTQIRVEDLGEYFILKIKTVESTHTDGAGVDDGEDSDTSVFFTKNPIRLIKKLEGPTYSFKNPALQLAVPARLDCMGESPTGKLAVYDLSHQLEYFHGNLPGGTLYFKILDASQPNQLTFQTVGEKSIGKGSAHSCDIGDWVRKSETVFKLRCDLKTKKCALHQQSVKKTQGCQTMGGCD